MTETADQRVGAVAQELPSRNLPPAEYRDLPEALPLRRILGPSIILVGAGISSGEYVLWPYITSQVGLVFMWAAVVGVLTQYFINMEIERYTLATGETAITGFMRMWKPWGLVMVLCAILPNLWPGWATSSITAFTFVFGLGEGWVVPLTITLLIIIGVILTSSPVVYNTVEKIEFFKVGAVLLFLVIAIAFAISASAWGDLATSPGRAEFLPVTETLTAAALLGALAFAGAGGTNNLVVSNWIKDKGLGMGAYSPKIVSPITGEEEADPMSTGYVFPTTEENLSRWRKWWRVANIEQFVSFFVIGTLSIIIFSLLAYSTVFGQEVGEGFDFIRAEGEILGDRIGSWFGILFWTIGAVSLFGANIGIVDYVSRIVSNVLRVGFLDGSRFWTESKLYFATVWTIVAAGCLILLFISSQPLVLLIISSALSGTVMFVYSVLLIVTNRRFLPEPIRVRGVRLGALVWAVLLFGGFSAYIIVDWTIRILTGTAST
jgi:hypothetical protein